MDLSLSHCRVCLANISTLNSTFFKRSIPDKNFTIEDLYRKCFNFKIEFNDKKPKYFCNPCVQALLYVNSICDIVRNNELTFMSSCSSTFILKKIDLPKIPGSYNTPEEDKNPEVIEIDPLNEGVRQKSIQTPLKLIPGKIQMFPMKSGSIQVQEGLKLIKVLPAKPSMIQDGLRKFSFVSPNIQKISGTIKIVPAKSSNIQEGLPKKPLVIWNKSKTIKIVPAKQGSTKKIQIFPSNYLANHEAQSGKTQHLPVKSIENQQSSSSNTAEHVDNEFASLTTPDNLPIQTFVIQKSVKMEVDSEDEKYIAQETQKFEADTNKPEIEDIVKEEFHFLCNICNKYMSNSELLDHKNCKKKEAVPKSFICTQHLNPKTFIKEDTYKKHLKNYHTLVSCPICIKENPEKDHKMTPNYLRKCHMRTQHLSQYYSCDKCGRRYKSLERIEKHLLKAHQEKFLKCSSCEVTFKNIEELQRHSSKKIMGVCKLNYDEHDFKCFLCDSQPKFESLNHKYLHVNEVHKINEGEKAKCSHCPFVSKFPKQLDRHVKGHLVGHQIICELCAKPCFNRIMYAQHLRNFHNHNVNRITCDLCGASLKNKFCTQKHMSTVHLGRRDHICHICSKSYTTKYSLDFHLTQIHNAKCCDYKCPRCEAKFVFHYQLQNHLKKCGIRKLRQRLPKFEHQVVEGNKVMFKCPKCPSLLQHRNNFSRHMRSHTNDRRFTCEICNKKFYEEAVLRIHRRIHSGEKPLSCNLCSKKFSDNSTFYKHRYSVHPEIMVHSCELCDKKYPDKEKLERHVKSKH